MDDTSSPTETQIASLSRLSFSRSAQNIRIFTGRFIRRVSDTFGRAVSSLPDRDTATSPPSPSMEDSDLVSEDADISEAQRGNIQDAPLRGRSRTNTITSTSPELCYWMTSHLFNVEYIWITSQSAYECGDQDIHRVASSLRRAFSHLYDLPVEEYPEITFPVGATGHKAHYRMDGQSSPYPRGAKGLKKRGDDDVPLQSFLPRARQSKPLDPAVFRAVGCFFPQPSKLSQVQNVDDADEEEILVTPAPFMVYKAPTIQGTKCPHIPKSVSAGILREHIPRSSLSGLPAVMDEVEDAQGRYQHLSPTAPQETDGQENFGASPVAGEEPADYYGPAKDYCGSLSSDSDSSDSDDEELERAIFIPQRNTDPEPEPDFTDFDGDFSNSLDGEAYLPHSESGSESLSDDDVDSTRANISDSDIRERLSIASDPENGIGALPDAPAADQRQPFQLPVVFNAPPSGDAISESGSIVHNDGELGVFHGLDEPPITRRPSSIEQLSALLEAACEFDHEAVDPSQPAPQYRPALPEGYKYLVPIDMVIWNEPHLIVSEDYEYSSGEDGESSDEEESDYEEEPAKPGRLRRYGDEGCQAISSYWTRRS